MLCIGEEELDILPLFDHSVEHPEVDDHATVGIIVAIEDKCPQRCVLITLGSRNILYDGLEQLIDTLTCLGRYQGRKIGIQAQIMVNLVEA